jgi:hypothetical protein
MVCTDDASGFFYTYVGSLTTPPCSGPVQWLIHPTMLYVTQEILDFMNGQIYEPNARPVQGLNGRALQKYQTGQSNKNCPNGNGNGNGGNGNGKGGNGNGNGNGNGKGGNGKKTKINKLAAKLKA